MKNQIKEPLGLTSSPGGSRDRVSLFPQQESEREQQTTAISGRKCLESSQRLGHAGLLARTLLAYCRWRTAKHLTRYFLTWRLKGIRSRRLLFQLAVLVRGTGETGSGLWLIPTASENEQDLEKFKKRMEKYPNGTTMPSLSNQVKMFPTPRANLLPGLITEGSKDRNKGNLEEVVAKQEQVTTGNLNPDWVEWLMGYPIGWTDISTTNPKESPGSPPKRKTEPTG